jgi:hypothetical protein
MNRFEMTRTSDEGVVRKYEILARQHDVLFDVESYDGGKYENDSVCSDLSLEEARSMALALLAAVAEVESRNEVD